MTLDEARAALRGDAAARVVYAPQSGATEEGVITEVRGYFVFVRYNGDEHSKATRPEDLSLATG
jgi:hypothetical protein